MLDTLKLRIYQGQQFIKDIPNAQMREQFRGFPIITEANVDTTICPTGAISNSPLSIDMGKCTFCGACSKKCEAIKFSNYYKLASTDRQKLIITEGMLAEEYNKTAFEVRKEIKKVFGKSLKLRQVSAGGCNGCERELNACSNVNFDMGRFGIDFVASPRHADGIVITGAISKNMAKALEETYLAVAEPKIIIVVGACAISGGIYQNCEETDRSFFENHKVDLFIPGCPAHPLVIINAILDYIGK